MVMANNIFLLGLYFVRIYIVNVLLGLERFSVFLVYVCYWIFILCNLKKFIARMVYIRTHNIEYINTFFIILKLNI